MGFIIIILLVTGPFDIYSSGQEPLERQAVYYKGTRQAVSRVQFLCCEGQRAIPDVLSCLQKDIKTIHPRTSPTL